MCTYFHTPEKQAFYESEHIFPMRMYPSMDHFETKKKLYSDCFFLPSAHDIPKVDITINT